MLDGGSVDVVAAVLTERVLARVVRRLEDPTLALQGVMADRLPDHIAEVDAVCTLAVGDGVTTVTIVATAGAIAARVTLRRRPVRQEEVGATSTVDPPPFSRT